MTQIDAVRSQIVGHEVLGGGRLFPERVWKRNPKLPDFDFDPQFFTVFRAVSLSFRRSQHAYRVTPTFRRVRRMVFPASDLTRR